MHVFYASKNINIELNSGTFCVSSHIMAQQQNNPFFIRSQSQWHFFFYICMRKINTTIETKENIKKKMHENKL